MHRIPAGPVRTTNVISAYSGGGFPDRLQARRGLSQSWYWVSDALVAVGITLSRLPVLTDDYVPIERLISPLLNTRLGQ
jgi:hypothetical protein